MARISFDIECLPNLFLIGFEHVGKGKRKSFEFSPWQDDRAALRDFIGRKKHFLIGFNTIAYDGPLLSYVLANPHASTQEIKAFSDLLIDFGGWYRKNEDEWHQLPGRLQSLIRHHERAYRDYAYHIDIRSILKVGKADSRISVKDIGIKIGYPVVMDMPHPHDEPISEDDLPMLYEYMWHDINIMTVVARDVMPGALHSRYRLWKQYGNDKFLSGSDSVLGSLILDEMIPGEYGNQMARGPIRGSELIPPNLQINQSTDLIEAICGSAISQQTKFSHDVTIGKVTYSFKQGGLHSQDGPGWIRSNGQGIIRDADVSSYYPSMILGNDLEPQHLQGKFLHHYQQVVDMKMKAGDKMKELGPEHPDYQDWSEERYRMKIIINAVFGKLGYKNYWLFDSHMMFKVTFFGQLYLIDLIEKLEEAGQEVISANTDGIVVRVTDEVAYGAICAEWQVRTGMTLEYEDYQSFVMLATNNYMAVKTDGRLKLKGQFDPRYTPNITNIRKSLKFPIVMMAVAEYYATGADVEDVITDALYSDTYKFCAMKKGPAGGSVFLEGIVGDIPDDPKIKKGLALKTDKAKGKVYAMTRLKELGLLKMIPTQRTNRYFIDDSGMCLLNVSKNGNQSRHERNKPGVALANDGPPDRRDINVDWYINEARHIIETIGEPQ